MGEFEAMGDVVSGAALARAVEPATARACRRRRPHSRARLPQLRDAAGRRLLPRLRPARPRPPHAERLLPRSAPRRVPFRGQDLAHAAAARVAPGRADAPLYRGRARALRLADRPVPVLGLPDVRGGQRDRRPIGERRGVEAAASQHDAAKAEDKLAELEARARRGGRRRASRPPRSTSKIVDARGGGRA